MCKVLMYADVMDLEYTEKKKSEISFAALFKENPHPKKPIFLLVIKYCCIVEVIS